MASQTPRTLALQDPTLDGQLRRWWSRRYGQPPNDPRFESQTQTYWLTEFYLDCLDEAHLLKATIEAMGSSSVTKATLAQRGRLMERFRSLQAILKGEGQAPQDDRLARDIAAQRQGQLPEFMRRKLAREQDDIAPMPRQPDPDGGGQMPELMRQKLRRQKPRSPGR